MHSISDYRTLRKSDFEALDSAVKALISQGYQPYGSPYVAESKLDGFPASILVCQAMVKYKSEADTETKAANAGTFKGSPGGAFMGSSGGARA